MKVLMLGTLTNSMNGSARSFVRLVNNLARHHDVYVVLPDKEGVWSLISDRVKSVLICNIIPVRRSLSCLLSLPLSMCRLFRLLKVVKPDIVHVNDIPWFYTILLCKLFNIPVVMHSRYYEKNRMVKSVISYFLSKADAVIYVSDFNRSLWNMKTKQQYVVHNPGIFDFKLASFECLPKRYALLVCRISEEKGVLEAIRLFASLKDKEMSLVIAGDALYEYQKVYLSTCKQFIEASGLTDRVLWLGNVASSHQLYVNAEMYIHVPNFEDPFPTTIMEALALGCRIVTNGRGGIKEQVSGFPGVCLISQSVPVEFTSTEVDGFLEATPRSIDRSSLYQLRFDEENFHKRFLEIIESVCYYAERKAA